METWGAFFEIVRNAWAPLAEQLNNIISFEDNAEILRRKQEELLSREEDVKMEIDRAEVHQGKKRKRYVELWMKNVKTITKEVSSIEKELAEERRFFSRLRLGNLIGKKIKEMVKLQEKGQFLDGLLVDPLFDSGRTLPAASLFDKITTKKTFKMIWDSLMGVKIGKIGVHGMGGVGKTTIMKHINNFLKEAQVFDSIIWVTVCKALNLRRLQDDIAKAIELNLTADGDEQSRSTDLFAALMRRKRFVLILDDIWEAFPLEDIGIPEPSEDNGCKIVLTTRQLGVCRAMETQRNVKVEILSEEEAWELFKDKISGNIVLSTSIEATAKLVAKECGGLPLAIITIGRALREVEDIRVWRNALSELKSSTSEIKGMEDIVFARLKFSYDRLRNDKVRACFLYCALYPEDAEIPVWELIQYWICEGLIDELGSAQAETDKGQAILNELQSACLLENVVTEYNVECVKMHDLVRDMATTIARTKPHFMIRAGIGLKELPKEEYWSKDLERISLMKNDIEAVSVQPKCPKLSTLLLQSNPLSLNFRCSFFDHLQNLRVLDLSFSWIKSLPESLSNLEKLHGLILRSCKISKVPSLAKLKELRVLNLQGTRIEKLPEGMEMLVKLRHLDLCYTQCLQELPSGVISKLHLLEYLMMYRSGYRWSSKSLELRGKKASIEEIMSLTHIVSLDVHFLDLPSFINYEVSGHWRMLNSFRFSIGRISNSLPSAAFQWTSKSIEFIDCNLFSSGSYLSLPENTLDLVVDDCRGVVTLSELPCLSGSNELTECFVGQCNEVKCILIAERDTLPNIEKLILLDLPNLKDLCEGVVPDCTFANLKILHVDLCHALKNLVSASLFCNLQNLEETIIQRCEQMEEIVEDDSRGNYRTNSMTLPRLKTLEFYNLPKLRSICSRSLVCNSLQIVKVWQCPQLKKLPFSLADFQSHLKEIRGSIKWWDALQWEDQNSKTLAQTLFKEM